MSRGDYVLVYFVQDHTFSVVHDEKKKLVNSQTANIQDTKGKWNVGKIMFRGTEFKCDQKADQLCDGATDVGSTTDCEPVGGVGKEKHKKKKNEKSMYILLNITSN